MADEDGVSLSAAALAALAEFYKEAKERKELEAKEAEDKGPALKMTEDWQMSQFWYSAETSTALAKELLALAEEQVKLKRERDPDARVAIACMSCPSTFKALQALEVPSYVDSFLFEYDKRFAVWKERFFFYDYAQPDKLPKHVLGAMDVICLDPPFLQEDCLRKFSISVNKLKRRAAGAAAGAGAAAEASSSSSSPPSAAEADPAVPVMLCTGAIMLQHARNFLRVRPVCYKIVHQGQQLQNPFALYVSTEESAARLGGWDLEAEKAAKDAEEKEKAEAAGAAGGAGAH